MIRHLFTLIWNQRRSNGWIFAELLIVVAVLWTLMDSLLVDTYTYYSPLGFDITDTYRMNLNLKSVATPGYVPDSLHASTDGDDLLVLTDNIRRNPLVDKVAIGLVACPYSWSNAASELARDDADMSVQVKFYQKFVVTPEYFDVFRIMDKEGRPLRQTLEEGDGTIVLSADLEQELFDGQSGVGCRVKWRDESNGSMTVASVCTPIRQNEYQKSNPCFYFIMNDDATVEAANMWAVTNVDCLIRMKAGFRAEDMEAFLQSLGDRIVVNNLYVSTVTKIEELRPMILKDRIDNMKKKSALVGFMLINVFFGIIGTFWLRTQHRRGEMGLRTALGASRSRLKRFMDAEGLCLLAATIPFMLLFILNVLYMDLPDTDRLAYTWWRFAITFGGAYLLLAGMICLGVWFPSRKIVRMNPAEALHYE